jgi:hypothetical protein
MAAPPLSLYTPNMLESDPTDSATATAATAYTGLSPEKQDAIYNALAVGMALDDAYIYARLTPQEILRVQEDPDQQAYYAQVSKQLEYSLLDNMRQATRIQVGLGKHEGTAWLLERLYPRYSTKAQGDIGRITLALTDEHPPNLKIVDG